MRLAAVTSLGQAFDTGKRDVNVGFKLWENLRKNIFLEGHVGIKTVDGVFWRKRMIRGKLCVLKERVLLDDLVVLRCVLWRPWALCFGFVRDTYACFRSLKDSVICFRSLKSHFFPSLRILDPPMEGVNEPVWRRGVLVLKMTLVLRVQWSLGLQVCKKGDETTLEALIVCGLSVFFRIALLRGMARDEHGTWKWWFPKGIFLFQWLIFRFHVKL